MPAGIPITVSQSFSTASSIVGRGEAGAALQQSMSERRCRPCTGRQSIAGHISITLSSKSQNNIQKSRASFLRSEISFFFYCAETINMKFKTNFLLCQEQLIFQKLT
ncbi:hypothetical protein AMECASPLE_015862 [Ameca splendens]|uniref:Uncharacterized protein n=1 Tax=Ameca splendens TaxID=208324 RepID=A0ABV1A8V9_9TELE